MSETRLLMLKDTPVLETKGFEVRVLDFDHLPFQLRHDHVSFDHIYHGWTETRVLPIGRANAKKILAGFGIRQNSAYAIASKMHFASLKDCYWMKGADEVIGWKEVGLFTAEISKDVADTALFGKNMLFSGKIKTPETSTIGVSAKAWYRDCDGGLWLYKTGRKELAAAEILDILQIDHVPYCNATADLYRMADERHIKKIEESGEVLVKSPIITNEETAIVTWDDYCENRGENGLDEFEEVRTMEDYYLMQVADYVIGNEDRHGENWGFFMDNETGGLMGLHPLFDHDHAFSDDKDIFSQTYYRKATLKDAAASSVRKLPGLRLGDLLDADKPEYLTEQEWKGVRKRARSVLRAMEKDIDR